MRVCVLGDGAWGTALALRLLQNGHEIAQWGPFPEYLDEMRRTRINSRFLPGVTLPPELQLAADVRSAVANARLVVMASPTRFCRETLTAVAESGGLDAGAILVSVAKGIEVGTNLCVSEIVGEILGDAPYAVLSGPSHAEEVVRGAPTLVVVAASQPARAEVVQSAFMAREFRVYTSGDVAGVELGGALKNVLAIAAGMCDGMGLGDNAKAALLTRGIAEMARLGRALGGQAETFSGLSGIGDLIVTCTSGHSRNRHVGEELGKGRPLEAITADMGMVVAEGVTTAEGARALARRAGVETPIVDQVYRVIHEGADPMQAVTALMTRDPRAELD